MDLQKTSHPIFKAVRDNNPDKVKELLQNTPNLVNLRDTTPCYENGGETPVHLASKLGHLEILKELIFTYKADYNLYDETNFSEHFLPIHCAASNGQLEIVKFFLEIGVNKNILTPFNKSSILDIAINKNHKICIEYFIDIDVEFQEINIYSNYIYCLPFMKKYSLKRPEIIEISLSQLQWSSPYWFYLLSKEFGKTVTNEMKLNAIKWLMRKDDYYNYSYCEENERKIESFLEEEFCKDVVEKEVIDDLVKFMMDFGEWYYLFKISKCYDLGLSFKVKNVKLALRFLKKDLNILSWCESEMLKSKRFYLEIYKFNAQILSYVSNDIKNYIFDKLKIQPYQKLFNFERNYLLCDIDISFYDFEREEEENTVLTQQEEEIEVNGKKKRKNVKKKIVVKKNVRRNVKKEVVKKVKYDKKKIFIPDVGFDIEERDLTLFFGGTAVIHEYERYATLYYKKMDFVTNLLKQYEEGVEVKGTKLQLQPCKAEEKKRIPKQ